DFQGRLFAVGVTTRIDLPVPVLSRCSPPDEVPERVVVTLVDEDNAAVPFEVRTVEGTSASEQVSLSEKDSTVTVVFTPVKSGAYHLVVRFHPDVALSQVSVVVLDALDAGLPVASLPFDCNDVRSWVGHGYVCDSRLIAADGGFSQTLPPGQYLAEGDVAWEVPLGPQSGALWIRDGGYFQRFKDFLLKSGDATSASVFEGNLYVNERDTGVYRYFVDGGEVVAQWLAAGGISSGVVGPFDGILYQIEDHMALALLSMTACPLAIDGGTGTGPCSKLNGEFFAQSGKVLWVTDRADLRAYALEDGGWADKKAVPLGMLWNDRVFRRPSFPRFSEPAWELSRRQVVWATLREGTPRLFRYEVGSNQIFGGAADGLFWLRPSTCTTDGGCVTQVYSVGP
ncbi:MAG: hypothetical protein ACOZIN_09655, partial [Myxococcota bacterium]